MYFHLIVRDLIYSTNLWQSKKLLDWIEAFQPNIIFFHGANSKFPFMITHWLSEKYNIPFNVYLTDDYLINYIPKNAIDAHRKKKLENCYKSSFKRAKGHFVIGELMAKKYTQIFNKNFHPIMNSVEFTTVNKPKLIFEEKAELLIVYAGGLTLGRLRMIIDFGELIKKCSLILQKTINIEIFTTAQPENEVLKQLNKKPLSFKGAIYGTELNEKLSNADFLLHVESLEKRFIQSTRLSISTKIPEYLSSGKCIIGYGPSEVASMRLLSENEIGVTITESENTDQKIKKLNELFSDTTKINAVSRRGFNYAYKYFNASKTREQLKKMLHRQL